MKKLSCLLLAALMLAALAACGETSSGESPAPAESPSAVESEAPAEETEAPAEESVAPAEASEAPAAEDSLLETARSFEGASLDELIAAIGEPESSDYAPSCLGEGEDGNLYYDGFTVYTYRDVDGGEVVNYVE